MVAVGHVTCKHCVGPRSRFLGQQNDVEHLSKQLPDRPDYLQASVMLHVTNARLTT